MLNKKRTKYTSKKHLKLYVQFWFLTFKYSANVVNLKNSLQMSTIYDATFKNPEWGSF